jgi:hypothetical protein
VIQPRAPQSVTAVYRRVTRRLPPSRRSHLDVVGYPSETSVALGERLELHLSARRAGARELIIERVGAIELSGALTADLPALAAPRRGWEGYGWPVTAEFEIPEHWRSGLYGVRHGADAVCSFVVRPSSPGAASRMLLHIPVLTAAAYEPAGGKSLYGFNSLPRGNERDRASAVSLHRPSDWDPLGYSKTTRLSTLAEWLDAEQLHVDYCSSIDLHRTPDLLAHYDCLVLAGHDEYWTKQMRDGVERFAGNGGNLVVLSGNTCYRSVRLEAAERRLVFHKSAADDAWPNTDEVTVAWADPPLNRPQNALIGVGFLHGAVEGGPDAYTVRFPSHWAFAGLDEPGRTSPFMHYETDAAAYVDEPEGYPRVTGEDGTPLSFTVLASAELQSWTDKPGRATMGVFSKNGTVFNVGTTDWIDELGADPIVTQVTRNVLARLGQRAPHEWEHVGDAPGHALASSDGRLFTVTSDGGLARRYPVGADVPWSVFGHAAGVTALTAESGSLYALTTANELACRSSIERDEQWHRIGPGPPNGTTDLAAAGSLLYAIDSEGVLWRAPAQHTSPVTWSIVPFSDQRAPVTALTTLGALLLASGSDGRLLRTSGDHLTVATGWIQVGRSDHIRGLACIEWMLFATTDDGRLMRTDLFGMRA